MTHIFMVKGKRRNTLWLRWHTLSGWRFTMTHIVRVEVYDDTHCRGGGLR